MHFRCNAAKQNPIGELSMDGLMHVGARPLVGYGHKLLAATVRTECSVLIWYRRLEGADA